MAELIWTESAVNSLNDIADYIALDNPMAAKKLVSELFSAVSSLEDFPESGRSIPELPESRYREIIHNPCRVIYKYDTQNEQIYILDVMRQEMEILRYISSFH